MSVVSRVIQAINAELAERAPAVEATAGGTVSIVVKLDAAGCPRRISVRTEVEHDVEGRRPGGIADLQAVGRWK